MIRIYATDCGAWEQSIPEAVIAACDEMRQQRIRRLQDPLKRAQCAAAGWMLTRLCGKDGHPPALHHSSHGKPYLMDGPFFSLSHTGRWVFCALSDKEVGLDAQQRSDAAGRVAGRCFTPPEREWIDADPEGLFHRVWAAKEAYAKYTGLGLVLSMGSYTVPLPPMGFDPATRCHWREWAFAGGDIAVCVCGEEPIDEKITLLTVEEG